MSQFIIAAVDDLFFASKIRAAAEHLNVNVTFVHNEDDLIKASSAQIPAIFLADLHSTRIDTISIASQLRKNPAFRATRIIGFYSHVNTQLRDKAIASGFDEVMSRSAFTRNLPELLALNSGGRQ